MKRIETDKWVYSNLMDYFNSDEMPSKAEAIKAGKAEYDRFFVGRIVILEFTEQDVPSVADYACDVLSETLCEECGEASDSWESSDEDIAVLETKITNVIMTWIKERDLQPSCYAVADIEEVHNEKQREV